MIIIITGNLKDYDKDYFLGWLNIGLSQAFDNKYGIKIIDEDIEYDKEKGIL